MQVKGAAVDATVGTGTSADNKVGLHPYDKNSSSQSLYTSTEIGKTGTITDIAYEVKALGNNKLTGRLKIYFIETGWETLTTSQRVTDSDAKTLVYDSGDDKYTGPSSTGWQSFHLTTPYVYTGSKSLIVATELTTTQYNTSTTYAYTETSSKSIVKGADSAPDADNNGKNDYADAFNETLSAKFSSSNRPNTKFTFNCTSGTAKYIGDGTNTTPFGFTLTYSSSEAQYLYTMDEIGQSGYITQLAFQIAQSTTDILAFPAVKIWMKEVAMDELSVLNTMAIDQMTPVFSGAVRVASSKTPAWPSVKFDTPFPYTGCGNLLVAVSTSCSNQSHFFFRGTAVEKRAVVSTPSIAAVDYVPRVNTRFTFANHGSCTNYTDAGFGICDDCHVILKNEFEAPVDITSNSDYAISNVGNLMWLSKNVNNGSVNRSGQYFFLTQDLDLNGYNWIPIGNASNPMKSRFYGRSRNAYVGHTISGIGSNNALFGTLSGGYLFSLYLKDGILVKNGVSGAIGQCLTLGSALVESGTATIMSSYCLSSDNKEWSRNENQMKSGQVTFELNQYTPYSSSNKITWYQTIDTDDYPMVSNTSKVVYHYYTNCTQDVYANEEHPDEHAGPMENAICSKCKKEPMLFNASVTLDDTNPYLRTKDADITGSGNKLTYTRSFTSGNSTSGDNAGKWQPFCVPFSFNYTQELFDQFELAEVYAYGVNQDTNNDGDVTSADQKSLIASPLNVDAVTEPNMPYLIRVKGTAKTTITITSNDGHLYKAENKSVTCETMKEKVVVTGNYQKKTGLKTAGLRWSRNGNIITPADDNQYAAPFRWYAKLEAKKSGVTFANNIPITSTGVQLYELDDTEKSSYTRSTATVVPDFCYIRNFTEQQVGNWQSFYVPFAITLDTDILRQAEFATIDGVETDGDADCIIVTKRQAGYTIPANTPCVIRVRNAGVFKFSGDNVTLMPAENRSLVFNANHKYTFTGVYEPFKDHSFTWYAIAKSDGVFHKASATATLPAYRFYMTIDEGETLASEVRLGFMEVDDEETGIRTFDDDASASAIYSIDGRRVQSENLQPGIYVKNGKKFRIQ